MIRILPLLFLFLFLTGCSGKSDSILSTPVQKDAGSLTVLNTSGFLGATVAGTSIDYTLTIMANGGLTLHDISTTIITNDPISFKGGEYPGTGGTCTGSLKSAETCTIILAYEPQDTASHMATIDFVYRDSLKSYHKSFQVSADSHPILSFEYGTSYDFGNKFIGSSTNLRVRISNTGKVTAQNISVNNLSLPFSMQGGHYPGSNGTCGSALSPGDTCDIYVNYSPTTNGEHLQDIHLSYFNTGRPESNTLHLMAWGFTEAQLGVSDPTGLNFGTIAAGVSHDKVLTITHLSGDVAATSLNLSGLNSPFNYKGGSFPGTGGNCTSTLSKNKGSCTIVLTLNTATSGSWNNQLSFSYFNGKETISISSTLSATTRQRAELSITPTSYQFDVTPIATEKSHLFTVSYLAGELPATSMGLNSLTGHFRYSGGSFPGSDGSCSSTLHSGTCTIALSYNPTGYGVHSLNTVFFYHDGANVRTISLSMGGRTNSRITAASAAFGNVVNGMSKTINITLTTSAGHGVSNLQVSSISAPFAFTGGAFPGTGGTCTTNRNASTSCTISLTFTPQSEGAHSGSLVFSYDGGTGDTPLSISLSGNATPAAHINISDANFESISVNSVKEMMVTITNSSTMTPTSANWTFPEGFSFKNGSFPGTGGNCWGSNCRIAVVFNPTEAKAYSGSLTLTYNDGTGNIKTSTASLSGVGVPTNNLFISNFDTVSFSSLHVGNLRDISFTLSHGGGSTPAIIDYKTTANQADYLITNDTCPASLSHGASCSFTVRFAPQSAGTKNSSFSVGYSNGAPATVTRLISGSATLPALITPSQPTISWGSLATDQVYDVELTLTHSGANSATTFTRTLTGSGFTKLSDTCTSTLNSSNSCKVTIRFSPLATTSYAGNFSFSYNNGFKTVTTTISLSGAGSPTSVLSFSAATYDFGKIIQTQTSTRIITITHYGPAPATNLSVSSLNSPYELKGGSCTDTLESGSCTLIIDFSPTTVGIKNQNVSISYHNGSTSRSKEALLSGEAHAQAIVSISEGNPYHFGATNMGGHIDKTFTLSNSGSVSGTGLTANFDVEEFSFKGGSFPGIGGNCGASLTAGANCSIVLTFTPTQVRNYNGTMTLNYHDGLRVQSELKNLQGTGSHILGREFYLEKISESAAFEEQEVFVKNSGLKGLIAETSLALYDQDQRVIFSEINHLAPLWEGLFIEELKEDINLDGTRDFLFSIQERDGKIQGYSIRCGRSYRVLERYLGKN